MARADFKGVNEEIAEVLHGSTMQRFRDQVGADGQPFKPRKPVRGKGKRGNKILIRTAQLRNSVHSEADRSAAAVGTNLVYARAHQRGYDPAVHGGRGRAKIDARPYLGIDEKDREAIGEVVGEFVEELIK
jgi:phage virion morphogenesis protein